MNRLELGKHWVLRLCSTMPDAPQRVCTRMGWHLAALGVYDDQELFALPDEALNRDGGGSPHFVRLRLLFQQRVSASAPAAPNLPSFAPPSPDPVDTPGV